MKKEFAAFALLSFLAVGCHGQIPPSPTTYACPSSATVGTYTPLNQSSPATALTYTWTPVSGTYCVIAQSVLGSSVSVPSNTAGPITATGAPLTAIWTAPTTGPAPSGYVLSQALAIPTTLAPPVLNASLAVAETQSDRPQLAKNAPANLTVKHGSGE